MEPIHKQKMAWQKDELAAMHHEEHVAAFVARGRLHTALSHAWLIAALALFILILAVPGVHQVSQEWGSPEGVQVLHLFRDIAITPQKRSSALRVRVDSLANRLAHGNWLDSGSVAWEELAQGFTECSQLVRIVNRYVEMDTLDPQYLPWSRTSRLAQNIAINPNKDSLVLLQSQLRDLRESLFLQQGWWPNWRRIMDAMVHQTLFSREYLRAWEKELEDASAVAQMLRPLLQQARFQIFGDLGMKAVAGNEGWVFYRQGLEYAIQPWGAEDPVQAIVAFQHQLRLWGVELLVVPVPNKETIYPDYLNPVFSAEMSGKVGHGLAVLDSLRAHGVAVVDLYSAFAQERQHDTGLLDALYLRDDTHWQLRGLRLASQLVAQEIQARAWFSGGKKDSVTFAARSCTVAREGDILAMTKLPGAWFPPEQVPCAQIFAMERDSAGFLVDSTLYKDDFRKSRILILGDSFSRIFQTDAPTGAGWIAHLAMELGEPVASLVSDGGASTLVREKLARKPGVLRGKKLVVWEFVERDYRFGDGGWKSIHLNP